jgi:hypothetical protein
MLSLAEVVNSLKGVPIAFISGGKYNEQIVYVHKKQSQEPELSEDEAYRILGERPSRSNRLSKAELKTLNKLIHEKNVSNKRLKEVLKQCKEDEKNDLGTTFKLTEPQSFLIPIPSINKRECQYVSGSSGSGKSRYCAMYMRQWRKLFPDWKIYLFSDKKYDPAYEGIELIRVNIRELIASPSKLDEVKFDNSLVCFDDIDTILDKKTSTIVQALQKKVLELCRQYNTYNLNINHLNNEGLKTKIFFNECDKYVFFPSFGNEQQLEYFMSKSIGLYRNAKKLIQDLDGWVIYNQRPPAQYFMNNKVIYLKKEINDSKVNRTSSAGETRKSKEKKTEEK